jgi:DNA topoisomerase-1
MRLFIVESPAKCAKIREYLGNGWSVTATMGHIRGLEESLDALGMSDGWNPRFRILDGKSKALKEIREKAKDATEIWLGTDDDREGEAISWHICQLLNLPVETTPRAIFHEVTESAIKASVSPANRKKLDMAKVQAQLARSMLDLLVGYSISPVLWKHIGYGLSAGRCQTPAVHIVFDREKEIAGFKSSQSWAYETKWTPDGIEDLLIDCVGTWSPAGKEEAESYIADVSLKGKIVDIQEKSSTQQPPLPLITSSLQQEIHNHFHIAPKVTMQIAQKLYEAGHITYMRTDNPALSDEARAEVAEYIVSSMGDEYVGNGAPKKKTSKKAAKTDVVVQGAHEAIRPTHVETKSLTIEELWSDQERKVYGFIWQRTVQSVMSAAVQKTRSIQFRCDSDNDKERNWKGSVSTLSFKGWKLLNPDIEDGDLFNKTAALRVGQKCGWKEMVARQIATQPPSRYSEAQLVKQLEDRGIGRPSTFASLISTILDRKYVEKSSSKGMTVDLLRIERIASSKSKVKTTVTKKEVGGDKDKIHLTSLGQSVIDFVDKQFGDIFAYDFTSRMESDLDKVAKDEKEKNTILSGLWNSIKERVTVSKMENGSVASGGNRALRELGNISIANTKKGILLIRQKEGADQGVSEFAALPPNKTVESLTLAEAEACFAAKGGEKTGEIDGMPILIKKGQYGQYANWNGVNVSYNDKMTEEQLETALRAKAAGGSITANATNPDEIGFSRIVGDYTIKKGQYGLYFFKTAMTTKKFVKFPSGLDAATITSKDCVSAYKMASDAATENKSKKPSGSSTTATKGKKPSNKNSKSDE